ncbi:MAG: dTMP kinase [Lachnospiraceae bacterium]|nr:dTMP kinase [Lachnospiraceae bacterium]MDE6625792.1 dTMP kinase [Lachnospiraceae bacterium]
MEGIFITMEGPDGSGKTTQINLLMKYLESRGYDIVIAREPGGTAIGEAIREIILNKEYQEMSHMTELFLYASARVQLVNQVIRPALEEGKAVICDRFVESSAVYQGIGRGLGVETVYEVNNYALGDVKPKLTVFMDIEAEEGIRRKKDQAELDRMEMEDMSFHQRVVEGYRQLSQLYPDRIFPVDATLPIEEIHSIIVKEVEKRFFK